MSSPQDDRPLPTAAQLAYARERLDARRRRALELLVTDEHVERVANFVVEFSADEPEAETTAYDVACKILRHLAGALVEPMMPEPDVAGKD